MRIFVIDMKKMKFIVIAILAFINMANGQLPEDAFPKCSKKARDLTFCLLQSVEAIRPYLIEGIPSINFPSLEPFSLDKVALDSNLPGFRLRGEATNIVTTGAGDFQITEFKIDYTAKTAEITIVIPKLEVTADYSAKDSKLVFFSADSTGVFNGTFVELQTKVTARATLDYEPDDDDIERTYLRVPYVQLAVSFGFGTTYRLIPTESNFAAKVSNTLVNLAPKRVILAMMKSSINKAAAKIVKKYLNIVLEKIPLNDIISDYR